MIYPVLLCGGAGTRLWPLSRKSYPKQFSHLTGEESLFQASARRLAGEDFHPPVVVTGSDFRFIVTEQLMEVGIDPASILIEPEGRNTAPAILAAALHLHARDPGALMLVAPSDHVVSDAQAFRQAVQAGVPAAGDGDLVTFGITPDRPETGYGYLEIDGEMRNGPMKLRRFVEKPDLDTARKMLEQGNFLWNAGIFLFTAKAILAAYKTCLPEMVEQVSRAVEAAQPDLGFLRLDPEAWAGAEDVSIDYGVMEHADNISVIPYAHGWSDLGGWDAVWRELGRETGQDVVLSDRATAIDCTTSLLRSESEGLEIVGIGLKNIIAVAMPDAVLVADMSRAQDVKKAVAALKERQVPQATVFPRDHRPWGWFESIAMGGRFQVKRIVVHPGAALSLQSHFHRAEHWVVVEGTALVTIGDDRKLVTENQSVYIPVGTVHRLENPGKVPMVLIEVQTGSYLGEDDILRHEDVYSRS